MKAAIILGAAFAVASASAATLRAAPRSNGQSQVVPRIISPCRFSKDPDCWTKARSPYGIPTVIFKRSAAPGSNSQSQVVPRIVNPCIFSSDPSCWTKPRSRFIIYKRSAAEAEEAASNEADLITDEAADRELDKRFLAAALPWVAPIVIDAVAPHLPGIAKKVGSGLKKGIKKVFGKKGGKVKRGDVVDEADADEADADEADFDLADVDPDALAAFYEDAIANNLIDSDAAEAALDELNKRGLGTVAAELIPYVAPTVVDTVAPYLPKVVHKVGSGIKKGLKKLFGKKGKRSVERADTDEADFDEADFDEAEFDEAEAYTNDADAADANLLNSDALYKRSRLVARPFMA